jgi:hypothetical protein
MQKLSVRSELSSEVGPIVSTVKPPAAARAACGGIAVDHTGSFAAGFVIAAVLALVGMVAYGVIVRRIEPIDWRVTARLRRDHSGEIAFVRSDGLRWRDAFCHFGSTGSIDVNTVGLAVGPKIFTVVEK